MVKGYVATTDAGLAVGRTETGEQCWSSGGAPVSAQTEAMEHEGASLLWLARDDGTGSSVRVWATNRGGMLADGSFSKVRSMHGTHERIVIGCEDGSLHVWEREMLHRRLSSDAPAGGRSRRTHVGPSGKTSGASPLTHPCLGPVICSGRTHSSNSSLVK